MNDAALHAQSTHQHVLGAVLAMSLCAFALVSSEFMPVSLLTPIADELSLTEGQAGQAISISGIFAVITSLFIAATTRNVDRKTLLLTLTGLMIVSGGVVAFAPNYPILMMGRALLGVAIGGCWSMSTAVMMRISPPAFVPKALALLQGGSALATAVAAPMGSMLGGLIGWRGAFFCVVPLATVALVWQAFTLPSMPADRSSAANTSAFRLLLNPKISLGMTAVALMFMGQFALFTYLRPFLEAVTHVNVTELSLLLLVLGIGGLVGTSLIGTVLTKSLYRVLIVIPLLMAFIAAGLVIFGSGIWACAALLAAWGLIATSAPVGWFTWLSKTLPNDAEAGGGLMVAVIQLAITLGATAGGLLYDGIGYTATFYGSAGLLMIASLLTVAVSRTAPPGPN